VLVELVVAPARAKAIAFEQTPNDWSRHAMHICMRRLDALPGFARDLVDLLVTDARAADAARDDPGP
jgi:hypothetical protein